jgi:hypothetical protein
MAAAPFPTGKIKFEIGISPGDINHTLNSRGMERRPSQIRMDYNTRSINHPPEARQDPEIDFSVKHGKEMLHREERVGWVGNLLAFQNLLPEPSQSLSDCVYHDGPRMKFEEIDDFRLSKDVVYLRYLTENLLMIGRRHGLNPIENCKVKSAKRKI